MKLKYILSTSAEENSRRILTEAANLWRENKKKIIIIVPEQFTYMTERGLCEICGGGIMGLEVISFSRLIYRIAKEYGIDDGNVIDETVKLINIKSAVDSLKEELPIYGNSGRNYGLLTRISSKISELKNSGAFKREYSEENSASRKLNEIVKIKKYSDELMNEMVDFDDYLNMVLKKIPETGFIEDSVIFIDRFSNFNYAELNILDMLMETAGELNISLVCSGTAEEEGGLINDYFEITGYTFDELERMTSGKNIDKEISYSIAAAAERSPLEYLGQVLLNGGSGKYSGENNTIFGLEAQTIEGEVMAAADRIIELMASGKYKWEDFAVILCNMGDYITTVKNIFDKSEINYFYDKKVSAGDDIMARFIYDTAAVLITRYEQENVISLIKSPFFGLEFRDACAMENHIREFGLEGRKWNQTIIGNMENIESIRVKILEKLDILKPAARNKAEYSTIINAFSEYFKKLDVENVVLGMAENLRKSGKYAEAYERIEAWNIIVETLKTINTAAGSQTGNLTEFLQVFKLALSNKECGYIPSSIDKVVVGTPERTIIHDKKVLFIIGANDGYFPNSKTSKDIFSDSEKEYMKSAGIRAGITTAEADAALELSCYTLMVSAKERLYISGALANGTGHRSWYLERIAGLFGINEVAPVALKNAGYNISQGIINTLKNRDFDLIKNCVPEYPREDIVMKTISGIKARAGFEAADIINGGLFAREEVFSVSRLEGFNSCEFSHFVKYGLRPRENKEYGVEYSDIGTLIHGIIEGFEKHVTENGAQWDTVTESEIKSTACDIFEKLAGKKFSAVNEERSENRFVMVRVLELVIPFLKVLADNIKNSSFKPIGFELAFGEDKRLKPLELSCGGNPARLEGRIDRADVFEDGSQRMVVVIDYKSSKKDVIPAKLLEGLDMQLFTYLFALKETLSENGKYEIKPAGAFYFGVANPFADEESADIEDTAAGIKMSGYLINDIETAKLFDNRLDNKSSVIPVEIKKDGTFGARSKVLTKEEFGKLGIYLNKKIEESIERIRNGEIKVSPYRYDGKVPCQYCSFGDICAFDASIGQYTYREIPKYKMNEVLEKMN